MNPRLPSREELLAFLAEQTDLPATKEVAKAFHLKGPDRRWLRQELRRMADEGLIERKGRRLSTAGRLPAVGVVRIERLSRDGDLVASFADQPDLPILLTAFPARSGQSAAPGDRVLARLERQPDGSVLARPIRLLEAQSQQQILGVYRDGRVDPVDRRLKRSFLIDARDGLTDGELVLVARDREADLRDSRALGLKPGRIVERLGPSDSIAAACAIALAENDIRQGFPSAALEEAEAALPPSLAADGVLRTDLRDLALITIDGEDARDFDDAVFAQALPGGGFRLLVAIADVAHYVPPGSALDEEARKRGNSVYLPDRVVPMLPEALSNGWCSLVPGEDRACLALWLTLSVEGRVTDRQAVRGLMRSVARCTYRQVQAVEDGAADHPQASEIKTLFAAYRLLAKARKQRGTLDLDLPEFELLLDDSRTRLIDVRRRARLDAHRLIEEMMILANVAVAEMLEARKQPLLFRVHDSPDRAKVEALNSLLKTFDLPRLTASARPKDFARVLTLAADLPAASLISEAILRSQAQAIYSPDNRGHFGLALASYAHFTSPIRRYADLIVHRALIRALDLPGAARDGLLPGLTVQLRGIGEQISATERAAAVAERSARERIITHHLAEQEGARFAATIVAVTRAGCFLSLDEWGAQGLLPFDGLPPDHYRHLEEVSQLVGERRGEVFSLGDRLLVSLRQVDVVTASLTFDVEERLSPPLPAVWSSHGGGKGSGRGRSGLGRSGLGRYKPSRASASHGGGKGKGKARPRP